MRLRAAATAVALTLALSSVSGCGSGSGKAVTIGDDPLSNAQAPAVDKFGTAGDVLTMKQIVDALPSATDMPKGWTRDGSNEKDEDDRGDKVTPAACQDLSSEAAWMSDPTAKATRAYKHGDWGPFFSVEVGTYSEDIDSSILNRLAALLTKCKNTTSVDKSGEKTTMTISGLDFPNLGEQTFAAHLSMTTSMFPAAANLAIIRIGHNLVMVIGTQLGRGPIGTTMMKKYARLTVKRLEA